MSFTDTKHIRETPRHFIARLLILTAAFMLLMQVVEFIYEHTPSQLFRITEQAAEDFDFTDMSYQVGEDLPKKDSDIVMLNIGSVPAPELRKTLASLIPALNNLHPKAIGIDLFFADRRADSSTDNTLDSLFSKSNIVFGIAKGRASAFPYQQSATANITSINFPVVYNTTIRNYYQRQQVKFKEKDTSLPSFACQLYGMAYGKKIRNFPGNEFMIHYSGTEKGFYNYFSPAVMDNTIQDFPAIDASDVLNNTGRADSVRQLIKNRIVIIGWLGQPAMDNDSNITDKFKVPVNAVLVNRLPTMPGAVIHANALQSLINDSVIKKAGSFWRWMILLGVSLLYFAALLLLAKLNHKFWEFIIELLLFFGSVALLVWISVSLMQFGYYVESGTILAYIAGITALKSNGIHLYDYLEPRVIKLFTRLKSKS